MNNTDNFLPDALAQPKRSRRGDVDPKLEDWIDLADTCHLEAQKPEVAAILMAYDWLSADQKDLGLSLGSCETLITSIQRTRDWKESESEEEKTARMELRIALDPILKGARRSYPAGAPQRTAYGIGRSVAGMSALGLLDLTHHACCRLAPRKIGMEPEDTLQGLTAAEIAAVCALVSRYKNASWAQVDGQRAASEYLELLRKEVEGTLNALRRDLQGAADQAFPHHVSANARKRAAFGLPPIKPLID